MSKSESCAKCYFFKSSGSGSHGFCRRFPAVFTHIDEETGRPRFFNPVVSPYSFCGEFEDIDEG